MLRQIKNILYAGFASYAFCRCAAKPHVAEVPLTSFLIRNYAANVDLEPGSYEQVNIYPYKHCYYVKKFNNWDYLIINDDNCDTFGDRIRVLRGSDLLVSEDFRDLEETAQGQLNLMIKRTIDQKGVKVLPNEVKFLE